MLRLPPPRLAPWRRSPCAVVGHYRVFDVCRVELRDADGRPRGDAFTMRCPDWCNVVALTPEDHVVFVWQYRFGTDALSLEIPGGVVDPGESPEQAARRELREETGYEAERLESLCVVEPNPALQDNRCHTFVAHGARPTAPTRFDPQEELETALVAASRLADLLDGGQVTHSLVQGALETFSRRRARAAGADGWLAAQRVVEEIEALESSRVLELAHLLRPGLTTEDVASPHDFPELRDPDWQHRDGVLAGVRSVLAALRAGPRRER